MTRATTLAIAAYFSLGQTTQNELSSYYDEVIKGLGTLPWICEAIMLPVTTAQALFTFPDEALVPLDVWYDNRTLDLMTHAQLDAVHINWPSEIGPPLAYTEDNMSRRTFRLYPLPDQPSTEDIPYPESPFGQHASMHRITMLTTVLREDLPVWIELPVCFLLLAREFSRESVYQDLAFAQGCQAVADLLMGMLTLEDIT